MEFHWGAKPAVQPSLTICHEQHCIVCPKLQLHANISQPNGGLVVAVQAKGDDLDHSQALYEGETVSLLWATFSLSHSLSLSHCLSCALIWAP